MKKNNIYHLFLFIILILIHQYSYSQSAGALIPDFRVNEYLPNTHDIASIGFDFKGNSIVIFRERTFSFDTSKTYCQRYDSMFNKIGNNFIIGHEYAGGFEIAVLKDGRFIAVWWTRENNLLVTYLQKYRGFGIEDGPRVKINEGNWRIGDVKIVADTTGSFVVAWRDFRYSELYQDIYFQRYDSSCNKIGSSIKVNDDPPNNSHYNTSMTMLKDGRFIISWDDTRNNGNDVYIQKFNKNGTPIGVNELVNEHVEGIQSANAISSNNRNCFVVSFIDVDYLYLDSYSVFYQLYDSLGNKIGNNIRVDEQSGAIKHGTKVSLREDNSLIVGWSIYINGFKEIPFAQRVNKEGVKTGTNFQIPVNINFQDSRFDCLYLRNDWIISLWNDNKTGDWDVYCNVRSFINPDSVIGIKPINTNVASVFKLYQNYPNPFNPSTKISFYLPERSFVNLTVYNIMGQEIKTLYNENLNSGLYETEFTGAGLANGVYLYRLTCNGVIIDTKKLILLK